MALKTTANYDQANASPSKEPVLVLEIEGVPFVFGSSEVFTTLRYDDPGIYYDGTYIYDGLRPLDPSKQKPLIDRQGSASTISQKLEQWDGRASVETFNIKLVDYQQIVTQICSPGVIIPEILNAKVRVFYGFKNISYPDDYMLLFRGYINDVKIGQGYVNFTFTDPSSQRKQYIFSDATSELTADILATDTTLTVTSTTDFYRTITNAKGVSDPGVTIGLVLDNKEIVTFTNADIISDTQVNVVRGQFGTVAANFASGVQITMFIQMSDNPINIALKTQLSGWNGPFVSGVSLRGIVNTDDGSTRANSITFDQGVDLERDYGLTAGDFIILSGSPNAGNNAVWTIADITNSNRTAVVLESGLVQENPTVVTTAAFRSKYDVYPVDAGISLIPDDLSVSQFESIRDTFVQVNFVIQKISQETSAKTWIETDLLKAVGGYSLTQGARISMGITQAPLTSELTQTLDATNVVDAKSIVVERGINSRFFYNEVYFQYDYDVIQNTFFRSLRYIDADAQARLKQVAVLQIDCKGLVDDANSAAFLAQRAARILQRYKYSAETITLSTFFGVGNKIDAGDSIILTDFSTPSLQIADTTTGQRGIYNRIMEVQERSIDITRGVTKMTLLSNNGYALTDRYAVVGPASMIVSGTTTSITIEDSFAVPFPGAEYKKWTDYQGARVRIHNFDYSNDATATFTLDVANPYIMHLGSALPFTPGAGYVVEFEAYDDTNATINSLEKASFVSLDPSSTVFSASSQSVLVLNSGYSTRYQAGMTVYVMSPDGTTRFSPDTQIQSVIGDVLTFVTPLGFVAQNGDIVQLGGFKDGGAGYRLL